MKNTILFTVLSYFLIVCAVRSEQVSIQFFYEKSYQNDCLCPGDGHSGYSSFSSMFSRDTKMFNDPVPVGSVVTGIDVAVYGTACSWGAPENINGKWVKRKYPGTVPLRFELNNTSIDESQFSGTCECDDCSSLTLSKSDPGGLPEYIYGGMNSFDVIKPWALGPFEKLFVTKVEITLHYIQGTAPQGPWTQKFPLVNPSARFGHVMSYIGGDKALMFGGWDALNNETWIYDKSLNKWTDLTPLINTTLPSPRYKTDMAYIGKDRVLLFGGGDDIFFDNETWLFDLSDLTWTKLNPATGSPASRFYHSLAYLGDDQVLMFGGSGVLNLRNDTWIFDLSENTWTQTALNGPKPPKRYRQGMARIDEGKALMFGGGTVLNDFNDTWLFDKATGQWQNLNPASPPSARERLDMAYIGEDMVLMFGGNSSLGFEDDTWVFDLSDNSWTINPYPPHPSARQIHAMAYLGSYMALLFGGDAESSLSGKDDETWIYNDTGDEPIDPPYADDLVLWLDPHSLQGMDSGDPVDLWEDSAPIPAPEDATIADRQRMPEYRDASHGIHGSPGVEFLLDYSNTGYGLSDILTCPYHEEITSGHADKWTPVPEDKSLFVVFQTGTKIDGSGEELPYYSDGNQVIFETGGPLSGMNMYISNGKLCFGMWNRFEQRYIIYDPDDGSDLYPLDPNEVYLANLEYNASTKRFRAIVNTRSGKIPVAASPLVDFSGFTKDTDFSGVGGSARTRFHNYSSGETYSHHFGGKIADIMLYKEFFDLDGGKNPQLVYDFLNDRYMDFDGLASGFFYPDENIFPQPKENGWKVISYDLAPGTIMSNVWPNPVAETATFCLNMEYGQKVSISLFNSLGEKVLDLHEGYLSAGIHSFPADASSLPNGIYIIKAEGEDFSETTKMAVSK